MVSSQIEESALHHHIRRRTVRLLDLTDRTAGGSAVTVKLGNRYFLATAAHVIPRDHEIRILAGEGHDENPGQFVARYIDKEDDLGLLEIDESVAALIDHEFTDSSQLITDFDEPSRICATLIGYPSRAVTTVDEKIGNTIRRTHSFSPLTLVTTVTPRKSWPRKAPFRRNRPRKGFDMFVQFDPQATLFQQDLTKLAEAGSPATERDVRLDGMSGCGIWLDRTVYDGVWRPEPILAGIDNGVYPRQGWARGTPISRWLALVVKHYKEFDGIRNELRRHLKRRRK